MTEVVSSEPICSRILIVDDEPRILDSLRQLLSDMADVSCTLDGGEALAHVREHAPDLILLDIDMPGANGFDICKAIKKDSTHQDIPVIFITGSTDSKSELRAFDAGAVDCIGKPFNIPTLRARVRTHLLLKRQSEELKRSHDLLLSFTAQVPGQFYQYRLYPDGRSTCPFISESVRFSCELTLNELKQDASPWLALTHHEDKPRLLRAMDESARELSAYRLEYRIQLPKLGTRWVLNESRPERLDDGSILWHGYVRDITEHKNTQLLLEEKEQLLRLCIENSPAAIMMLDREMRHVAVSRRLIEDYRLGDIQLIGRSHYEVFANIPERWRIIHQRGLAGESLRCDEDVYVHPDGATDFTRWEIRPWYSGEEVGGIILFTEMITARKHAELKERRLKNLYRALSETNDAILRLEDETALFAVVCRIAVEFGELPLAWIGIPDAQSRIVPVAVEGRAQEYLRENYLALSTANAPEGRGRVGIAFREMKPSISNDVTEDAVSQPFARRALHYGLKSIGAFPIVSQKKPYAVFAVYSDHIDAFDEEIIRLLEDMTANIGFALDNFAREAARRQAERALQLTQFSVEKAADPIFWLRSDGKVLFVNEAACSHLGYAREELLNLSVPDFCPSCTDEVWAALRIQMDRDKAGVFETVHCTKDGRSIPVEITANCTEFEGEEFHFASVRDISERKQAEEVIWRQANFDALTGLPNRYYFAERLEQEIARAYRSNLQFALMFIDLDRFKEINDAFGHSMGDELLRQAAERIRSCIRKSDIAARLGGDEFIVLLPEFGQGDVERIVRAMVEKLSAPFAIEGKVAHVSASIGIALYPHDAADGESLLRYADKAMYAAKGKGKNRYSYYDAALQEAANARRSLIRHLHAALEGNQFEVVYQPIIDLATGSISKAEALLRWHHPERGMISPAEFIPLAEETGIIVEIGDWVFRQASGTVKRIREHHHAGFQISINKSPVQFLSDGTRYKTWLDHLLNLGIHGDGIAIEVTENVLMDSTGLTEDKLKAFRGAGMQISLDDFGTGYSSLSYLQKFEFDYIKIDKSFVCNLQTGSSGMALCEAMIAMAHRLGIKVVAEGVETQEQRSLLVAAGCDYAQGYLFARPMREEQLFKLVNDGFIQISA